MNKIDDFDKEKKDSIENLVVSSVEWLIDETQAKLKAGLSWTEYLEEKINNEKQELPEYYQKYIKEMMESWNLGTLWI